MDPIFIRSGSAARCRIFLGSEAGFRFFILQFKKNILFLESALRSSKHKNSLKRLSHEMNLAFDDVGQKGTRPFLKFFMYSNDFIKQKVYFPLLTRVYVGLIMLAAFT